MLNLLQNLKLIQVEESLSPWRRRATLPPPGGWVRAIRTALGMTSEQLAKRMRVSPQNVRKLEKGEAEGKLTLESLRRAAEALDCRLVYVLVPRKPLDELVRDRARVLAEQQLTRVSHSMKLEAQGVAAREERRQLERLTEELLRGNPRKLWE